MNPMAGEAESREPSRRFERLDDPHRAFLFDRAPSPNRNDYVYIVSRIYRIWQGVSQRRRREASAPSFSGRTRDRSRKARPCLGRRNFNGLGDVFGPVSALLGFMGTSCGLYCRRRPTARRRRRASPLNSLPASEVLASVRSTPQWVGGRDRRAGNERRFADGRAGQLGDLRRHRRGRGRTVIRDAQEPSC
jgi:hypothetical protein